MPALVTAEEHGWPLLTDTVLMRDRRCIFADTGPIIRIGVGVFRTPFTSHFCRDRWGEPIPWFRLRGSIVDLKARGAVELDHVPWQTTLSKKAADDEAHLVVACAGAHRGTGPSGGVQLATSHEGREFERAWLAIQYPEAWADWLSTHDPHDVVESLRAAEVGSL